MLICSAEQSHERVRQLPHPDPSGSSFLQSSCHGEGDGWGDHRQRSRWGYTLCRLEGAVSPEDTLSAISKGPFR